MTQTIVPGKRTGTVSIPSSKSVAHRLLICAALSHECSTLTLEGMSKDISATISSLTSLGAEFENSTKNEIRISPVKGGTEVCSLCCGESGSTLRFMMPVAAALGKKATFLMSGLLPSRPHDVLINVLGQHGVRVEKIGDTLVSEGKLTAGTFEVPGNISSQYISGLLFALPLLEGDSIIDISGKIESSAYIGMTEDAIKAFGITFRKEGNKYFIPGRQKYSAPSHFTAEKDWSNAAFFLCMGAMSDKGITLTGMNMSSKQGDKKIADILKQFGADIEIADGDIHIKKGDLKGITVDAAEIPDLVPTISALAQGASGTTRIINAQRLRFKESDRLKTTAHMLNALGGAVTETEDGLIIEGKPELGAGTIDSANDHRIAISAAVASCICTGDVIIPGSECVEKSYPDFWRDFYSLEVMQ